MKTNILILLALSTSVPFAPAAQPAAPSVRPNMLVRPSAKMPPLSAPRPSIAPIPPKATGAIRPPAGRVLNQISPSTRARIETKPGAVARGGLPAGTNQRLGGQNGAAQREGFSMANRVREFSQLRQLVPDGLRENAIQGNAPRGPGKPNLDIGSDGGFSGREIRNPLDRNSGAGAGLTDIRGSADSGRQGTRRDDGPMSTFGLGLATRGPNTSTVHIWNHDGNTYAAADTTDGTHLTTEHHDTNGRVVGYTDSYNHTSSTGVSRTTDTYDARGRFTGSETVTQNDDGSSQSKSVAADGTVVVTENDGHGHVTQHESAGSTGSCCCDRCNGDVAMGGPMLRVADVTGLKPIDLLRQTAEGEQTSGGENTMTSGRISSAQVNRGGRDGNQLSTRTSDPHGHALRSAIGSGLAGPSTGGSSGGNGGGNRPD